MSTGWIVFIVVAVIAVALIVVLTILGKRYQKKNAEQQEAARRDIYRVNQFMFWLEKQGVRK